MSKHKEQHYVPRVYLRQFSPDKEKKTIGVWLFSHDKLVIGAPIKSQCADTYFYGKDLVLEGLLQQPETWYGKLIAELAASDDIGVGIADQFRFFWVLQHVRAKVNIKETQIMSEWMRQLVYRDGENSLDESWSRPVSVEHMAKIGVAAAQEVLPTTNDLASIIVSNDTHVPFVTSDNPSVLQNKFLSYGVRRTRKYGLGSAGIYIFMALSPRLGYLAYDRDVYHIPRQARAVLSAQVEDVHSLNAATLAQAAECVYFRDLDAARPAIEELKVRTPTISRPQQRFTVASSDETDSGERGRLYRVTDEDSFRRARRGLMHVEKLVAEMPNHLPALKLRQKMRYVDTNSQAGLIRHLTRELRG